MTSLSSVFPTRQGGYWGTGAGEADVDVLAIRNGDVGTTGEVRWSVLPLRGFTHREADRAVVRKGDIVLTTSGNCGNVAAITREPERPTAATNFVRLLRVDPHVADDRYAFHFLRSPQFTTSISPFVRGATIKNLSVEAAFAVIDMPTPPLREQRRIAAILDHADAIRAKRHRVLAHLDTLTRSTFEDMFDDVEGFTTRLADVAEVKGGKRLPKGTSYSDTPTSHPYIRVTDLRDGGIRRENLNYLPDDVHRLISRYTVDQDDVVISIAGSIGLTAAVPAELAGANLTENAAKIVPKPPAPYIGTWLSDALQTKELQEQIASHVGRVTIGKLALFRIEQLMLKIPPLEAQRTYLTRRDQINQQQRLIWRAVDNDDALFSALQSRAFRGEL